MAEAVLVDNDVILKLSAYDLAAEGLDAMTIDGLPPAMLGVARFVIGDRLSRGNRLNDSARARAASETMITRMSVAEPTDYEISAAADLEAAASRLNLQLDGGESQLLAMLVNRGARVLLTGDKRAIAACARVEPRANGRIASLEQLMLDLVGRHGCPALAGRVCAEPAADRALAVCFGCSRGSPASEGDIREGLESYVRHLRVEAPDTLLASSDLAALTP